MKLNQYILNSALPFDLSCDDFEADRLFNSAAVFGCWDHLNKAETHEQEIAAADIAAAWIANHWREILPEIAAKIA
jgi:hypothetical protein